MHGKYGQTIGKMITHVEIFDAKTHNPIAFRHAVIRDGFPILVLIATLGYAAYCLTIGKTTIDHYVIGKFPPEVATDVTILGMILLVWYWAEIVTMLTNEKRRALHDFIAGTVVLRTNID